MTTPEEPLPQGAGVSKSRPRWTQFSLWGMLVVMVQAAVLLGWYVDRQKLARSFERQLEDERSRYEEEARLTAMKQWAERTAKERLERAIRLDEPDAAPPMLSRPPTISNPPVFRPPGITHNGAGA